MAGISFSARILYHWWKSEDPLNRRSCIAYVCGVVDGWNVLNGKKTYDICLTTGVTCSDLTVVVFKYLEGHPDGRPSAAGGLVGYSLQQAYPCKK